MTTIPIRAVCQEKDLSLILYVSRIVFSYDLEDRSTGTAKHRGKDILYPEIMAVASQQRRSKIRPPCELSRSPCDPVQVSFPISQFCQSSDPILTNHNPTEGSRPSCRATERDRIAAEWKQHEDPPRDAFISNSLRAECCFCFRRATKGTVRSGDSTG